MMKRNIIWAAALLVGAFSFTACSNDDSGILPEAPDYERLEQPTEGAFILTLEGKEGEGINADNANMVYVDLEAQQQTKVNRMSWHLAFYSGEESRVTLNQSFSRAYATEKFEFATVTEEDANKEGFPDLAGGMTNFSQDKPITDDTDGDLDKTLFGTLSTNPAENKVFLLATEELPKSDWYKVKVTAQDGSYLLEYGNINATVAKRVIVTKNPAQRFIGFSLSEDKIIPLPQKWHLMWAKAVAWTTMPNGKVLLGPSSDVVTSNRNAGVEVAEFKVQEPDSIRSEFEKFALDDTRSLEFRKDADVMGTDWRLTPMPNAIAPGPRADRFYVFRDAEGKYFKVRFLHFCEADGGERGKPVMEAASLN